MPSLLPTLSPTLQVTHAEHSKNDSVPYELPQERRGCAHAVPLANVLRADEVQSAIPQKAALANAPKQANGLFVVPKIVE